jgi:predicted O-methyltransferase YrrM
MSTLTSPPLSNLLEELFADAAKSDANLRRSMADASAGEVARRALSEDYRSFYMQQAKDLYLAVSAETGRLIYMLARSINARNIVEFGTSFGLSTLHLAAALKDNGGGRVIGSEFEPSKVQRARDNLRKAGLLEYVDIREGDALDTLAKDLPATIDLVLLDGAKPLYVKVLKLLEPRLRPGALLVGDNADMCPEYVERVRAADSGYLSVPFVDDVELSMRL